MSIWTLLGKRKMRKFSILERFLLLSQSVTHLLMSIASSPQRFSWSPLALALCGAVVLGGWFAPTVSRSQAPATTTSNIALNAVLTKLKAQQDLMAANQTKIEAQAAQLAERTPAGEDLLRPLGIGPPLSIPVGLPHL